MSLPLQPPKSNLCSAYAIFYLSQYKHYEYDLQDIISELPITQEYGIGPFDVALFFQNKPFSVIMQSFSEFLDSSWRWKNSVSISHELHSRSYIKEWEKSFLHIVDSPQYDIYLHPTSMTQVKAYLSNGCQAIVYLNSAILYNQEGYAGHYVYLISIEENQVWIQDSHWQYGGKKSYSWEVFHQALKSGGDYIIWVT